MADNKKSINLLPEYLRSDKNSKFLSSTIDQLIQTPQLERVDGYIGSILTPNYNPSKDFYLKQSSKLRKDYPLEPALVFKDESSSITDVVAYDDLINELSIQGSKTDNHDRLFRPEFYSYNPLIDWDKLINYSKYYWLPTGPELVNLNEVDIDDIIGNVTYTMPNGFDVTNGLLILVNNVKYIVEGVGSAITLVDFSLLESNESLSRVYNEKFDSDKFDEYPFDGSARFPLDPAYVTINKASADLNPWSRYNRWFHIDVLKLAAEVNGNVFVDPLNLKARRPIIEFNPNLQLYNFGKKGIRNIDIIDNETLDAFDTINGTFGYYVDGVSLQQGMRIVFNADINGDVRGKIYRVSYVLGSSSPVLTLVPAEDFSPNNMDSVSVNAGEIYAGTSWHYNSGTQIWSLSQQLTQINQAPLFDLFDSNEESYSSETGISNFSGNKIFGYDIGTGAPDPILGFPLKYQNSIGVGSFLFKNYFMADSITVTVDNTSSTIPTGTALIKINNEDDSTSFVNVWTPAAEYQIPIIETQTILEITDVLNVKCLDTPFDPQTTIIAFVNGTKVESTTAIGTEVTVTFNEDLKINDVVSLNIFTSKVPNEHGYYEPSLGLINNPLNNPITNMTLSELADHLSTMVNRYSQIEEIDINSSNIRDVSEYAQYGTRLIINANPISFAQIFLGKKEHNVIDSLRFAADQYNQFKMNFLRAVSAVDNSLSSADAVDLILSEINVSKDNKSAYYSSDMVAYGSDKTSISYTVSNINRLEYPVGLDFDLSELSFQSVLLYLNGNQLVVDTDYTFNKLDGKVIMLAELTLGDIITITRYNDTLGSFVPSTPSKLGLYPKYAPTLYQDNTYVDETVSFIQCHDGSSILAYGDYRDDIILEFEKRIYNNIKVSYNAEIFDISAVLPGAFRTNKFLPSEVNDILRKDFIKWSGVYNIDPYVNNIYTDGSPFTWNYKNGADVLFGTITSGYWRGLFKYFYDTDRPSTHPWEMLGFFKEPSWWRDVYGTGPYTSTNNLLWSDLELGFVRGTGETLDRYARPDLSLIIPVDTFGELRDPSEFLVGTISEIDKRSAWQFGDHAPAETAWRRSSYWPFALNVVSALLDPCNYTAKTYDLSRTSINALNQITYLEDDLYLSPNKLIIGDVDTQIAGYGVYVIERGKSKDLNYTDVLSQDLNYASFNLFHKLGSFASKEKLQIFIDSVDPVSSGPGTVLPVEDYSLILNVSNPIKSVSASGIIIQKFEGKFIVKGYNKSDPYFEILKPIKTAAAGAINVGGVSAPFTDWTNSVNNGNAGLSTSESTSVETNTTRYYKQGQIVRFNNKFYKVKVGHTAGLSFDPTLFQVLPSLPITGGATAQVSSRFENSITQISYGTEFTSIQDVYDFIIGYGAYLESQGFIFDYYNADLNEILNWKFSGKEFLFWTTQNWADNNLITLSPFANKIKYSFANSIVDNISTGKYEYSLLKADGKSFPIDKFRMLREDGICTIETVDTEEGLFFATLRSVQKEHGMVFNNSTIFNDTIYDIETGYRQRRMKLSGFRVANWNGDISSPGFVYDSVDVSDWKIYSPYQIGKVVRYNGSYYQSAVKISGDPIFDFSKWVKLRGKPVSDLLPNFDYKINQFEDFYSLDIDNFDAGQQQLAQHLIGYTPRPYLNNIFTNPTSQYKFYQGFIKDKGTKNAIDKISKAGTFTRQGSIDFKEEWAFRIGEYGAYETYNEVEFILDEGSFLENPYVVKFVDQDPENAIELVNYIKSRDLLLKSTDYIPALTFNTTPSDFINNNLELTTAGYVRPDDITVTAYNKNSLLDIANNTLIQQGDTVWLGFLENGDWTVYRYINQLAKISGVFVSAPATEITFVTDNHHNLKAGDIVSVVRFNNQVNGVYTVVSIPELNQFTVASTLSTIEDDDLLSYGALFKFEEARFSNFETLSRETTLLNLDIGSKVWIDQGEDDKWAVYEKIDNYTDGLRYKIADNPQGKQLGYTVFTTENSNEVIVAAPGWKKPSALSVGRVVVFDKEEGELEKQFEFSLNDTEFTYADTTSTTQFGYSISHDVAKSLYFIGAPESSNVRKPDSVVTDILVLSTGTGTIQTFNSEGLVKISQRNEAFNQDVTVAVLAHPNATTSTTANYARFGHSVYSNNIAKTSPTTLLVGAPGDNRYQGGPGNVYAYRITSTATVTIEAHPAGISLASTIALTPGSKWGHKIAGSKTGNVIAISAPDFISDQHRGVIQIFDETLESIQDPIYSPFGTNDKFGYDLVVSSSGKYLFVSSVDVKLPRQSPGKVAVYINTDQGFVLNQIISNPLISNDLKFGYSISISEDEKTLLISALGKNRSKFVNFDTETRNAGTRFDGGSTRFIEPVPDAGTVYLFNNFDGYFIQADEISDPNNYPGSKFGASVVATNNTLIIGSPAYASYGLKSISTTTEVSVPLYENIFVQFSSPDLPTGSKPAVEVLTSTTGNIKTVTGLRLIYSGTGYLSPVSATLVDSCGNVLDPLSVVPETDYSSICYFEKLDNNSASWKRVRHQPDPVNVNEIKRVVLIDSLKEQIADYLDIFDPLKGKIPGIAEQELKFKSAFDPAIYTIGLANSVVDTESSWIDEHIGDLWWDLSTAKYMWYEQGNDVFRKNNWGRLFPGASIDVYEWVKSDLLPSEWAAQADTPDGLTRGISGQPKYPDNSIVSVKQLYNNVTGAFENVYFFWVKNKVTVPDVFNRRISSYQVASLIADPVANGLKFIEILSSDSVAFANVQPSLVGNRISANIVVDAGIGNISRHTEWVLLEDGNANSMPTELLDKKLIDSLLGHDIDGNLVPSQELTYRNSYGIGIRPQQSLFKDRLEALRNLVDFSNSILIKNRITDNYSFDNLNKLEEIPDVLSRGYDLIVEDIAGLENIDTLDFSRAVIECYPPVNGRLVSVRVINPGYGYINPPLVKIAGGRNAEILTEIDNLGRVVNAYVSAPGSGFTETPIIEVREHRAIVQVDEKYSNRWTEHAYDYSNKSWIRTRTQAYNTPLYWTYVDWKDDTYTPYKDYAFTVSDVYKLTEIDNLVKTGDYIKVNNAGNNRFIILERTSANRLGSFSIFYDIVYSEKGTIQILDSLWNFNNSNYSYDDATYEETLYDQIPDLELLYILLALKEDLFVKDLKVNWNKFFFNAVKYALTEQKLLDWAFKTSFISVENLVGSLDQRPVYKLDNEKYFEEYIKEVKPYHTQIRNYVSKYNAFDEFSGVNITDFDLPSFYNVLTQKYETVGLGSELLEISPWKEWANNYKYQVTEIVIGNGGAGYSQRPDVIITTAAGDTGFGATAEAYIRAGKLYKIVVTNLGTGYVIPPIVTIVPILGDTGTGASATAILGNSPVRKNNIGLRFDRVKALPELNVATFSEPPVTMPGNVNFVNLTWMADDNKINIIPTLDGKLVLATDYRIEHYSAEGKGYNRQRSRFVFLNRIPDRGQVFKISYKKHVNLYTSVDRIENLYQPTDEMPGANVPLLMYGAEYPKTNIQGLPFEYSSPFSEQGQRWYNQGWEDQIDYYISARLSSTATVGDTVLTLNTTTGIVPGQLINILNSSSSRIRNGTIVEAVNATSSTITISAPSYRVKKMRSDGLTLLNNIVIQTDPPFTGNLNEGDVVIVSNVDHGTVTGFNGTYVVSEILDNDKFSVAVTNSLSTTTVGVYSSSSTVKVSSILSNIDTSDVLIRQVITTIASTGTFAIETGVLFKDINKYEAYLDNSPVPANYGIPITGPFPASEYYHLTADATGQAIVTWYQTFGQRIVDIKLYAGPEIEFWKLNHDAAGLDSAIEAGSWNESGMLGALGFSPDELIIDGDSFINSNSSYAPEECVPGQVGESLGINVYTKSEKTFAIAITNTVPVAASSEYSYYKIGMLLDEVAGILVHFNGQIFYRKTDTNLTENNQFYIDGDTLIIAPQSVSGKLCYTIMTLGGNKELDTNVIAIKDQEEALVSSLLNIRDVQKTYVLFDGQEIPEIIGDPLLSSNVGYVLSNISSNNNRACVKIYNMPPGEHTIEAWFFKTKYGLFNRVNTQVITVEDTPTSVLTLQIPPESVQPASTHAIVELDTETTPSYRKRLDPPWVSYYKIANDQRIFDIDNKNNRPAGTYSLDTVKVYANGYELRPGFDFIVNSVTSQIILTDSLLNNNDALAVMGLVDYDYFIVGDQIYFATPLVNQSVRVITFTNHDDMLIRTERFNGTATKRYTLSRPTVNDNFVWVYVNGIPLTARYDYEILEDMRTIQLGDFHDTKPGDDVTITSIDPPTYGEQILGYRVFNDILGRSHYKRLAEFYTTTLSRELMYSDTEIHVTDASRLIPPNPVQNKPGVILVDGERIEFFAKDGNVLKQLRRNTLGTAAAFLSEVGTRVTDQSPQQSVPYADTTLVQSTLTTTATSYTIDPTIISLLPSVSATDQVSVYYGGRLLRKSIATVHDTNLSFDTTASSLVILAPEFSINTSTNELQLNISNGVVSGLELKIVQKTGQVWSGTESLLTSDAIQAKFLRAKGAELPDIFYYGGDPALLEDSYFPLTDDNDETIEGY
jgi:hypothetical protein